VYIERPKDDSGEVPVVTAPVIPSDSKTYTDPSGLFSVSYPKEYQVATSSNNGLFSKGVSFVVPESLTDGTNLSEDSRIYIEVSSASSTCSAALFADSSSSLTGTEEVRVETFGITTYDVVSYSDAGAGNFYEGEVYTIKKGGKCVAIQQFVHSSNIGNYPPGTVTEFDREAFDKGLRTVLTSFK
jgi:hypothetical protein